jgi:hypothetical protein
VLIFNKSLLVYGALIVALLDMMNDLQEYAVYDLF